MKIFDGVRLDMIESRPVRRLYLDRSAATPRPSITTWVFEVILDQLDDGAVGVEEECVAHSDVVDVERSRAEPDVVAVE